MSKKEKRLKEHGDLAVRAVCTARTRRLVELEVFPSSVSSGSFSSNYGMGEAPLTQQSPTMARLQEALQFTRNQSLSRDSSTRIGVPFVIDHEASVPELQEVEEAVRYFNVNPEQLIFHIQKSQNDGHFCIYHVAERLRQLGAGVSVDSFIADGKDFEVLASPHVNFINCDKHLIKSAMQRDLAWNFVHGLVALARQTQKEVVFGGIDTKQEFHALSQIGDVRFHGEFSRRLLRANAPES